jgi:hypothetical protein
MNNNDELLILKKNIIVLKYFNNTKIFLQYRSKQNQKNF